MELKPILQAGLFFLLTVLMLAVGVWVMLNVKAQAEAGNYNITELTGFGEYETLRPAIGYLFITVAIALFVGVTMYYYGGVENVNNEDKKRRNSYGGPGKKARGIKS